MRIALGLKHLRQVTTSAPIPSAPTLTWTSGTSVRDPVFTLTGILAGDIVQLQIDDDPAFGSTYGDDSNTVDSTEAADGQLTFSGIPTLAYATTYYARARITRAGVASAWSNTVNKTTDAAPASASLVSGTGSTGAGTNRSQFINTSGTPVLTFACNADVGAACLVRSTDVPPSKAHFEAKCTVLPNTTDRMLVGVSDSALALGASVFTYPGQTGAGATLRAAAGGTSWGLRINGGDTAVTAPFALAVNDTIVCEFDTAAKTISYWIVRSGTPTLLISTTLTSNIPTNWTADVGWDASNGNTGLSNFGGSAWAKTPSAGYSGW
jgi:hypothetical protein